MSLTLETLRAANLIRLAELARRGDKSANFNTDQWFKALVGEVGEFADWSKKHDRGDMTFNEFRREAAKELADVQTYLDLLAWDLGLDLGRITIDKFNEVSTRRGSSVFLSSEGEIIK